MKIECENRLNENYSVIPVIWVSLLDVRRLVLSYGESN